MDRRATVVIAAAALSAATFQNTSAADMATKAPPAAPTPAYSWTGFYVGANIGGGWGNQNITVAPNDPIAAGFINSVVTSGGSFNYAPSVAASGVLGGLQLGYNLQLNRSWLAGLETDFNLANVRGSNTFLTGGLFSNAEVFAEQVHWFGTLRGRLGYLPFQNLLAYTTGGLAYGRVDRSANFNTIGPVGVGQAQFPPGFSYNCVVGATCFAGSSSTVALGWTIGAGLEYAVWNNLTVKAEYFYVSLNGQSITTAATAVLNPGNTPSTLNAAFGRENFNVARVGINYHF